jgi:hypothetical protein
MTAPAGTQQEPCASRKLFISRLGAPDAPPRNSRILSAIEHCKAFADSTYPTRLMASTSATRPSTAAARPDGLHNRQAYAEEARSATCEGPRCGFRNPGSTQWTDSQSPRADGAVLRMASIKSRTELPCEGRCSVKRTDPASAVYRRVRSAPPPPAGGVIALCDGSIGAWQLQPPQHGSGAYAKILMYNHRP